MKHLKLIFNRMFIFGLMIFIQVLWFIIILAKYSHYSTAISIIGSIISGLVVLWIVNKNDNPAYKMAWIIPILLFPVSGGLLYVILGNKKPAKRLRHTLEKESNRTIDELSQDQRVIDEIRNQDERVAGQNLYLSKVVGYPIYKNTETKYYNIGESNYEDLIKELNNAKKFIFLEYFIIEEGQMWNGILEILERKVKEGVDVRLIYDDVGCINLLPYGYNLYLERKGIKCIAFNPFVPFISLAMNNRDHRKITIIDGHTGFTGGINLADEYINVKERFGHWKDTGIMLKGEGVWNLTVMFLRMWNAFRPTDEDYSRYRPEVNQTELVRSDGYVQPYGDSPLDEEIVGENAYMNIINGAKNYVYIFTPYLIIDNEMMTSLCLAAKKGVDVRIVMPGIPDKKTVFKLTRSYYTQLLESGVRIYEYTPGFIHAKVFICDDEIATVGTINMDYRSLYLHFECGVYLYKCKCISDIKKDTIDTMNKSREFTDDDVKKGKTSSILQVILRLFAPLM